MKRIKKLLSFVICMSMVFTMMFGTMAFADTQTTEATISGLKANITVSGMKDGDALTAYQIIVPDIVNGHFIGYKFVKEVNDWVNSIPTFNNFFKDKPNYIDALGNSSTEFKDEFYSSLATAIQKGDCSVVPLPDAGTSREYKGCTVGQYLMIASGTDRVYRVSTASLLPEVSEAGYILNSTECSMKSSEITITKKIDQELKEVVKGLGDLVKYTVKADVPIYQAGAVDTKYYIEDTMPTGLEITTDASGYKFKVEGITTGGIVDLSDSKYYISKTINSSGYQLDFNYSELNNITIGDAQVQLKQVVVTYTAKVTDEAAVGPAGNINEAKLIYSINPYVREMYNTKTSTSTVYTFGVTVVKYEVGKDNEKLPLKDAIFELQKKSDNGYQDFDGKEYTTDSDGFVSITQLGEGEYQLVEVAAPVGYNKLTGPVTFTITAARNNDTQCLTGHVDGVEADPGYLKINIENAKTLIPSTGGSGTLIFTVIGILLMAGAIVYLIIRKRMASVAK